VRSVGSPTKTLFLLSAGLLVIGRLVVSTGTPHDIETWATPLSFAIAGLEALIMITLVTSASDYATILAVGALFSLLSVLPLHLALPSAESIGRATGRNHSASRQAPALSAGGDARSAIAEAVVAMYAALEAPRGAGSLQTACTFLSPPARRQLTHRFLSSSSPPTNDICERALIAAARQRALNGLPLSQTGEGGGQIRAADEGFIESRTSVSADGRSARSKPIKHLTVLLEAGPGERPRGVGARWDIVGFLGGAFSIN
jgi:hypothetical protein